jgi:hypothetical protein
LRLHLAEASVLGETTSELPISHGFKAPTVRQQIRVVRVVTPPIRRRPNRTPLPWQVEITAILASNIVIQLGIQTSNPRRL